jgi:hypothetical protein
LNDQGFYLAKRDPPSKETNSPEMTQEQTLLSGIFFLANPS